MLIAPAHVIVGHVTQEVEKPFGETAFHVCTHTQVDRPETFALPPAHGENVGGHRDGGLVHGLELALESGVAPQLVAGIKQVDDVLRAQRVGIGRCVEHTHDGENDVALLGHIGRIELQAAAAVHEVRSAEELGMPCCGYE